MKSEQSQDAFIKCIKEDLSAIINSRTFKTSIRELWERVVR